MYVDYRCATIDGEGVRNTINDPMWNNNVFLSTTGKHGAAITETYGLLSAASIINATIDRVRDWVLSSDDKTVTVGIPSNGEYGIPEDVMFGFPVTTRNGRCKIIKGLETDEYNQDEIEITLDELKAEHTGVRYLL